MSKLKHLAVAFCQMLLFISIFLGPFIEQETLPFQYGKWHFQDNLLLIPGASFLVIGSLLLGLATHLGLDPRSPFHIFPFLPKPQVLVTTGIYRYIRHPQTLGWLLGGVGYLLVMGAKLSWILMPICLLFILIEIPYEEDLLRRRYPEYASYMKGTYRLIPCIW
ncbi:MAG TPA: isoprenylcysteine carboxylmethyltransferase family protein [Anaerolineae bacterium]|nr:isoprenylcysteine carboxylmethyltransferase family protein [Anaerolineae bacterium]